MDKLIELLNEYEWPELEHTIIDWYVKRRVKNMVDPDKPYEWCNVLWYSKSFWFIKWLVDNDKIDRDKILKENWQFRVFFYDLERVKNYDRLVMYLSVEDNPIEFLCEILK